MLRFKDLPLSLLNKYRHFHIKKQKPLIKKKKKKLELNPLYIYIYKQTVPFFIVPRVGLVNRARLPQHIIYIYRERESIYIYNNDNNDLSFFPIFRLQLQLLQSLFVYGAHKCTSAGHQGGGCSHQADFLY